MIVGGEERQWKQRTITGLTGGREMCSQLSNLPGANQMPNWFNIVRTTTNSLGSFGAHCAGIIAENQVDLGESMKHDDHISVGCGRGQRTELGALGLSMKGHLGRVAPGISRPSPGDLFHQGSIVSGDLHEPLARGRKPKLQGCADLVTLNPSSSFVLRML
ncbi:hypothetical protein BS78_01G201800 [Paspalum vaginatum]|nr:hypothetical protein BS78_01G201800 [Paspalum vaginatum]